jgi:hypothetical protein
VVCLGGVGFYFKVAFDAFVSLQKNSVTLPTRVYLHVFAVVVPSWAVSLVAMGVLWVKSLGRPYMTIERPVFRDFYGTAQREKTIKNFHVLKSHSF